MKDEHGEIERGRMARLYLRVFMATVVLVFAIEAWALSDPARPPSFIIGEALVSIAPQWAWGIGAAAIALAVAPDVIFWRTRVACCRIFARIGLGLGAVWVSSRIVLLVWAILFDRPQLPWIERTIGTATALWFAFGVFVAGILLAHSVFRPLREDEHRG